MSNEAAVIRGALPGNTVKRLARLMGAPVTTARTWLYREVSASRRRELALALLDEMSRQDIARNAVRRRLAIWAGDLNGVEYGVAEEGRADRAQAVGPARAEGEGIGK